MNSEILYLVTTADERTWPKEQPILFLGEWCRLYNRKSAWQHLDAEVVPYHWDDRKKLHRDYLYLKDLYEELLSELALMLNALHGVDHSVRYWRILVGPWLGYFVQILFDRWAMIERALNNYDIAGVRILDSGLKSFIPNDMDHFNRFFVDDPWNEAIYGQLLRMSATHNIGILSVGEVAMSTPDEIGALRLMRQLKRLAMRVYSRVSSVIKRDDEALFLSTYLPKTTDLRLQWRLGQIPKLWRSIPPPVVAPDGESRKWILRGSQEDGFPAIVRSMIPKQIPTIYLEGYSKLNDCCDALPWPKRPKLIFTSDAFGLDDVFKVWAAEKVESGRPLLVGQHGGNYAVSLWNYGEDHQCAISDAWLSWGWKDESNEKITPVGNLKSVGRCVKWDPDGFALMVEMAMPRYSYHMYSVPVASQWLEYFDEQIRFVAALPKELQNQLLIRLYSSDCGWCQKQRWQDKYPHLKLDSGTLPIERLIEKSRLYIATYNSTVFLESLAMNVPTIMFWNPEHWELRPSAVPYFDVLKDTGIFHEAPENAAKKMVEIWDDVAGWWSQPAIQQARAQFCEVYSRTMGDPVGVLSETLTSVVRRCERTRNPVV